MRADVRLCVVWLGRWTDVLSGFNTAFVIIFAVEALMKIIAFGLRLYVPSSASLCVWATSVGFTFCALVLCVLHMCLTRASVMCVHLLV